MGGVSATGAGGTAAVVNSQPSPHRVCEIAVRASRWKSEGTDDAPARLIERKRRRVLPGAFPCNATESGAMLPVHS